MKIFPVSVFFIDVPRRFLSSVSNYPYWVKGAGRSRPHLFAGLYRSCVEECNACQVVLLFFAAATFLAFARAAASIAPWAARSSGVALAQREAFIFRATSLRSVFVVFFQRLAAIAAAISSLATILLLRHNRTTNTLGHHKLFHIHAHGYKIEV
jgi:hypothetical protein